MNYAIKVSHAAHLLKNIQGLTPLPSQGVKPENAVKTVEGAIAMVMIY